MCPEGGNSGPLAVGWPQLWAAPHYREKASGDTQCPREYFQVAGAGAQLEAAGGTQSLAMGKGRFTVRRPEKCPPNRVPRLQVTGVVTPTEAALTTGDRPLGALLRLQAANNRTLGGQLNGGRPQGRDIRDPGGSAQSPRHVLPRVSKVSERAFFRGVCFEGYASRGTSGTAGVKGTPAVQRQNRTNNRMLLVNRRKIPVLIAKLKWLKNK